MFQVCQGTCLCAPSPEGYGKGKVLYCYGEVVLQRANLRTGEEEEKEADGQMFQLQLAQLVGVAVLLCAILLVLISIRRSISKLHKQIKKIVHMMTASPPPSRVNTLEKKHHMEGMNGNCVKFEKEVLRQKQRPDDYKIQGVPLQYPLDTMSVNSEIA